MNIGRRGFLGALIAAPAVPLLVKAAEPEPPPPPVAEYKHVDMYAGLATSEICVTACFSGLTSPQIADFLGYYRVTK